MSDLPHSISADRPGSYPDEPSMWYLVGTQQNKLHLTGEPRAVIHAKTKDVIHHYAIVRVERVSRIPAMQQHVTVLILSHTWRIKSSNIEDGVRCRAACRFRPAKPAAQMDDNSQFTLAAGVGDGSAFLPGRSHGPAIAGGCCNKVGKNCCDIKLVLMLSCRAGFAHCPKRVVALDVYSACFSQDTAVKTKEGWGTSVCLSRLGAYRITASPV
jgi:hypothetical protein